MLERRLIALVSAGRRGVVSRFVAPVAAVALIAVVLSVPHPEMGRDVATPAGATGAEAPRALSPGGAQAPHHH
jgi:hypothetical protein